MVLNPILRGASARTPQGERFGLTYIDPGFANRGLKLWSLMTELQMRTTLQQAGLAEASVDQFIQQARVNVSQIQTHEAAGQPGAISHSGAPTET